MSKPQVNMRQVLGHAASPQYASESAFAGPELTAVKTPASFIHSSGKRLLYQSPRFNQKLVQMFPAF